MLQARSSRHGAAGTDGAHESRWRVGPAPRSRTRLGSCKLLLVVLACGVMPDTPAEYGDVVINNYAETAGMRPVVFPHWFHRIRYTCKVCHADLGFEFKAGGNNIKMVDILEGRFCGSCHNGEIAWGIENCDLCHSAKPETKTQVHRRSLQGLSDALEDSAGGGATEAAIP